MLCFLAVGPTYEPLRWHPRFPALLQTIGLLSLARATGLAERPLAVDSSGRHPWST